MTLSRRQMLKLGAGAAGLWIAEAGLPERAEAAGEKKGKKRKGDRKKIPVGLELWSVRKECEKDLPKVLRAVAEMGYTSVELAHSYYGYDAPAWRKLLDENGLKSCGMHMSLAALEGDEFQKTVDIHKALGTPYLIVASLPKKSVASLQAIKETAKKFNEIAEKLAPHGMKVGYHCHGGDFVNVEGTTPWEAIAENTKPDVLMQIDIGNCLGGGGDPIAMIKKYPGRSVSVHLKDYGGKPGAVLGEGEVDWKQVFRASETVGGVKQYVVEEEGREGPESFEAVRRALANLRKMGK